LQRLNKQTQAQTAQDQSELQIDARCSDGQACEGRTWTR
jgi:hypothetical protein